MSLTSKEKSLLQENLNAEYLCIRKYKQYASMASDSKLKQVFTDLANKEQTHADTIKSILSQNNVNTQVLLENYADPQQDFSNMQNNLGLTDAQLLNDALSTEKHISGEYNTSVLESACPKIRKQLQHIQQEEQQHAETLFNEMKSRGWYNLS
ncbi:hypothetical protein Curi_c19290 [Gottschalkia acidurici 9a]|uniref:Rubrerythrin n=1 Tax=Gottschalkia acidurici (strain ATCC 7906 / DSM 604 / BCRC 14475 / CIP 104303 / KCTC 5404 / NCIMB 10678 / 9a) TaxID=1128398 RepID=K0B086_GOTA9|nr:spore coat protein [Gottschalkia acidurici]AFS78934.1 hypothetical protein Curi_c19290 [Gottschalkia acidurici 9a]